MLWLFWTKHSEIQYVTTKTSIREMFLNICFISRCNFFLSVFWCFLIQIMKIFTKQQKHLLDRQCSLQTTELCSFSVSVQESEESCLKLVQGGFLHFVQSKITTPIRTTTTTVIITLAKTGTPPSWLPPLLLSAEQNQLLIWASR